MRDKLLISFFSDYEGYKMNALLDEDGEQRTLSDIQNQHGDYNQLNSKFHHFEVKIGDIFLK